MSLLYKDVFPFLVTELPFFPATKEDWVEPTPYIFLSEAVLHVCQSAASGSLVEARQLASLLEKLAKEGDRDIQDLVKDALETLNEQREVKKLVVNQFGPEVLRLWGASEQQ